MPPRLTPTCRLLCALAALAVASGAASGCGETARVVAPEKALHDPVALTRMAALREVSRTSDPRHVPELIEMLDDEDPGIRLMAGAVLEHTTGHSTGYQAHAAPAERREQVLLWRRWWAARPGAVR